MMKQIGNRLLLLGAVALAASSAWAQAPPTSAAAPIALADPSAALRDALAAACDENETAFARFLTADSAEAFTRFAPVTRAALMKRLVLLDSPGKPEGVESPSGRPVLRCSTPGVTTEMQLGGASVRENLAFIRVEIHSVGESADAAPRRVTFGLVREGGAWKLLSVGLLLLDLPSLEQQWALADAGDNESSAIANLQKIAAAIRTYHHAWGRLPPSLTNLGPATKEGASPEAANLLDAQLASGTALGYIFRYVILPAVGSQKEASFELAATPLVYGKSGRKSFLIDTTGGLHGADKQGALAGESDPQVRQP